MVGAWVYGAIVALLVLHVMALQYAYRNAGQAVDGGRGPVGTVWCPIIR